MRRLGWKSQFEGMAGSPFASLRLWPTGPNNCFQTCFASKHSSVRRTILTFYCISCQGQIGLALMITKE
jgi:hypothetical protein